MRFCLAKNHSTHQGRAMPKVVPSMQQQKTVRKNSCRAWYTGCVTIRPCKQIG